MVNMHQAIQHLVVPLGPPMAHKVKDGPIHWAVQRGDQATTERLLDMQVSLVDEAGVDLLTPLHWAARRGHTEVVMLLVRKGADLQLRDKFGQTAAHWAAWNGHSKSLQVLLEHGTDVNARDVKQCTPLYDAAYIGHPACVRVLLSFGADPGLADDKGRCPLRVVCKWEFADHRHKDEIQDLLLNFKRPVVLAPLPAPQASTSTKPDWATAAGPRQQAGTAVPQLRPAERSLAPSASSPALLLSPSSSQHDGDLFGGRRLGGGGGSFSPDRRAASSLGGGPSPSMASRPPLFPVKQQQQPSQFQHKPFLSLTKTFFPFELSSTDYAHRALDLLTSVLLDACNRAVQQGVLAKLPYPACRDFNDVDTFELLRFMMVWPLSMPSREAFLHHLYSGQQAVGSLAIYRTTLDSMLDKVTEVRSAVLERMLVHNKVPAHQVTVLLELVTALAVLMGGPEEEEVAVEADRLKTQFAAHHRSKMTRLQEMHVAVPLEEEEAEEIVVLAPGGGAGGDVLSPASHNKAKQYQHQQQQGGQRMGGASAF